MASPILDIVLVGGGHAHVLVLDQFRRQREPGVRLTLIARELDAPYSGMLPGLIAGQYDFADCHVDLPRLAQAAGANLIHGTATGIDRAHRRVSLADGPPVSYNLLSLDTGITPDLGIEGAREHAVAVKPISTFWPKWQAIEARARAPAGPRRFVTIGAGPSAFELTLAIRQRLASQVAATGADTTGLTFSIVGAGTLLETLNPRARRLAREALAQRSVVLIENDPAVSVSEATVKLASGRTLDADAVLAATAARPPAWFADTGLALDAGGYLALRSTLQSLNDDAVFAAGDCASIIEHPREKAGVFAVRQGPILAQNLRLAIRGASPMPFRPQRDFLVLMSLADGTAIGARGPFAARGRWAMRWKERIDRAFVRRFNGYRS